MSLIRTEQTQIKDVYTDQADPSGFVNQTATLNFTDGTRTFTITGAHDIYINGIKYAKTTASIVIEDIVGLHWVYYNSSGVLAESATFPGWYLPVVATVYWDGAKGLRADERHGINMPGSVHDYLHKTVGATYISGLAGTFTNTTLSIASGSFADEDRTYTFDSALTACNVLYNNGSANWTWDGSQAAPYKTVAGIIQYNNSTALANVTAGNYVAYWVFATNDIAIPIAVLMGQRQDATLESARTNNLFANLALGTFPYQDAKLLYRVIYQNVAGTPTYIEAQDYRTASNLPSGVFIVPEHNSLRGLQLAQSGVTYGHISDGAQTIAGAKTFSSLVTAQVADATAGFYVNATSGNAKIILNNNHATNALTGFSLDRLGTEKWFVGLNATAADDAFNIISGAGSTLARLENNANDTSLILQTVNTNKAAILGFRSGTDSKWRIVGTNTYESPNDALIFKLYNGATFDSKLTLASTLITSTVPVKATLSAAGYGFYVNQTAAFDAYIGVDNNNDTLLFTGVNFLRKSVLKWGMGIGAGFDNIFYINAGASSFCDFTYASEGNYISINSPVNKSSALVFKNNGSFVWRIISTNVYEAPNNALVFKILNGGSYTSIYTLELAQITALTPFFTTLAGTVKTTKEFLRLTNTGNAADMDGTASEITWYQAPYNNLTPVYAGGIRIATLTDWTSDTATHSSQFVVSVKNAGTVIDALTVKSDTVYVPNRIVVYGYADLYKGGGVGAGGEFLRITNTSTNASMIGTSSKISFYHMAQPGTAIEAAKIRSYVLSNLDIGTPSTVNVGLRFGIIGANTLFDALTLEPSSTETMIGINTQSSSQAAVLSLRSGTTSNWRIVGVNSSESPTNTLKIKKYNGATWDDSVIIATHYFKVTTDNTSGLGAGFIANVTAGAATIWINNNNASRAYTGTTLQRQGTEKWFVGMDNVTDDLQFRNVGSSNILSLSPTKATSIVRVQADVSGADYAFYVNATTADALIGIDNNNETRSYAGTRLFRQAVEKWFVGMGVADDTLLFRNGGTLNAFIMNVGANTSEFTIQSGTNSKAAILSFANNTTYTWQVVSTHAYEAPNASLVFKYNSGTYDPKLTLSSSLITSTVTVKANVTNNDPGFYVIANSGKAWIAIDNNNATEDYTGISLMRESTEKWFLGMTNAEDLHHLHFVYNGGGSFIFAANTVSTMMVLNTSAADRGAFININKGSSPLWTIAGVNTYETPNDSLKFKYYNGVSSADIAFFLPGKCMLILASYDTAPTLDTDGQCAFWMDSGYNPKFTFRSGGVTTTKTITAT